MLFKTDKTKWFQCCASTMVSLAEVVSETEEGSVVGVASTEEETRRFLSCVVMAVS